MRYVASALSGDDDARGLRGPDSSGEGPFEPSDAAARPAWRPRQPADALPEGYLPLREVKDMGLLGRWTPLDDKMSPCLPAEVLAAMRRRRDLGDPDAEAWLSLHARAYAGDPDAQRLFGSVCENGSYRGYADLQRAFFWYYRAARQGDMEARQAAERLMRVAHISPAALAEPVAIYPGEWRITAHVSEQLTSTSLFDLAEDGSATGCLTASGHETPGTPSRNPVIYRGAWTFDGIGNVLTIVFDSSNAESRRWRADDWQIEILACRAGSLFGRDRKAVRYTIEYLLS